MTVRRSRRNLDELTPHALTAALALAELHFVRELADGGRVVDPRDARFLLSGQVGTWRRWRDGLVAEECRPVDLLLRYRPRRLATESGFRVSLDSRLKRGLLPRYRQEDGGGLLVVGGVPPQQVLAEALGELEQAARQRWWSPPVADGGQEYVAAAYLDAGQGRQEFRRSTYLVPDISVEAAPLHLEERPGAVYLKLVPSTLVETARRIDEGENDPSFSLHDRLAWFLHGLRVPGGGPVTDLGLRAGLLNLLVAPTGTGKSLLMRVAAAQLAGEGHVVVLVTPTVESSLDLVERIERDMEILGLGAPVVALLSARNLVEVARLRTDDAPDDHGRARWTWQRLGYSCLLPAASGPAWQPGGEPCTDLQRPGEEGRHLCPLVVRCGKWEPWRRAAGPAQVIVTNHAYFQEGLVPIPSSVDGIERGRMPAQEFLLRRASAVFIDEIDAFQARAVDQSGRTLVLARRDDGELLLRRLDRQRQAQVGAGTVPRELELDFQRALKRLDYVPERYLSAVVNGFIDPEDPIGRRQPRLHLPRRWDNLLACRLWGLDEYEERPTDSQLDAFQALFRERQPEQLPDGWASLRHQLRLVVSQDPAADRIGQRRDDLIEALSRLRDGGGVPRPAETAQLMLRRAFLDEMQRDLAALEQLLPLMRDAGLRLADEVETALDRGPAWLAAPEGPIGRSVFGFAVTGDPSQPGERTLSAEIIAGDPHAYTAELGMTTAAAVTGSPRIVLGLSATACLPGSPTFHVHADTRWYLPDSADAGTGRLSVQKGAVTGLDGRGITFSGADRRIKTDLMAEIGLRLWHQSLEDHLRQLHDHEDRAWRERARVLLVTNSYQQAVELCRGLIKGGAARSRLCVAVPTAGADDLAFPEDVHRLPASRLGDFPRLAGSDVLISPFVRVARGLNIIVEDRSALGSIWVCVRPLRLIDNPSALVAHTGAHARLGRVPADDPAAELATRHQRAADHFERINRSNPAFSRLPDDVRTAVFADVLADLIQLAGRARRGGTDTTLYLVDNAFHPDGTAQGSDFGSLFRSLWALWTKLGVASTVQELFGTTLDEFARFSQVLASAGGRRC